MIQGDNLTKFYVNKWGLVKLRRYLWNKDQSTFIYHKTEWGFNWKWCVSSIAQSLGLDLNQLVYASKAVSLAVVLLIANLVDKGMVPLILVTGAITLDTATNASGSEPGVTHTFAHTCNAGTDTGIVVMVSCYGSNRATSGVTYNSDALTLGEQGDGNNINVSIWYKPAPDTGSNNVVITQPASANGVGGAAVSMFGVQQTTTPDSVFDGSFSASGGVTSNITTVADQCWIFDAIGDQTATMNVAAGQTKLGTLFGDTGGCSYKTNVSSGANTMGWTWSGSDNGRHAGAAYAPAGGAVVQSLIPRRMRMGIG